MAMDSPEQDRPSVTYRLRPKPLTRFLQPPVPDPRTPQLPYQVGQVFTAVRHVPPKPFGRNYKRKPLRENTQPSVLVQRTQLQHCLMNPVEDGQIVPNDFVQLTIVKQLRTGTARGAQLVLMDNGQVAKIFDPLYYSYVMRDAEKVPVDVVNAANTEYSQECAAYETLDPITGGKQTPKYGGSWTVMLPMDSAGFPKMRAVRLILLEYLVGISLIDVESSCPTREQASALMVSVLNARVAIRNAGVLHGDLAPRNIICAVAQLEDLSRQADIRVAIFDFGRSYVPALDDNPYLHLETKTVPDLYWNRGLGEFYNILPLRGAEVQAWLRQHWHDPACSSQAA